MKKYTVIILLTVITTSCNSQEKSKLSASDKTGVSNNVLNESPAQIGQYVVETYEDSKGNLWFGTLEKGVARYDGNALRYFTTTDGLPSNRVVSVIEDSDGDLWFGTDAGISKYDGKKFINFNTEDGLCNNMISNLFIDSKNNFWIGTWGGVCRFDGQYFKNFIIPYPNIETKPNNDTKDWNTSIIKDSKGNIWFGRDGYGASKYDGKGFVHFTKKDGLYSNNVQTIAEDNEGNIWIGTRVAEKDNADASKRLGKGGLNKYDGEKFIHFPDITGVNENDVYEIYKDNSGHLWISTTSNGVYKYENNEFKNYPIPKSTMSMLKDRKGNIWLGCAGGLFCISADRIVNVKTNGPWQ